MNLPPKMEDVTSLFDQAGGRKYVCASERQRFLAAAGQADAQTRTFALVLAFSGCRISEALSVSASQLDPETNRLILRTLKRRRQVFRGVPIPADLMRALMHLADGKQSDERLWSWCRQTAWRRIKRLMTEAGIRGSQATAKGLRHGFGIANAEENVPPALTQRWMGHARLETTAIYQHALGDEERAFAKRIWRRSGKRRH
jgi:integrase/recombinase XerD